ncbi:N-acetylglucosamine-binding protein GbpA [Psychrobium sp. 1_MG-2023]|uniref:N-acetylglucosamine-binding protein GbpA n=1 Tax=Psychrobium sp. 1_MG-2023 TaxID=3062624 RepID=UPI000C32916E|nr:N-acetylglucosamine-binding protein GbpA [Psychrobium sp. 1_MG-2023]MDP2559760.1 N-acetylglucosamine-binding protein GbpA [Psychrobium sp. 1_MG-2023]PKF59132.1 N-acetylglucosamine-binding protein GbpA [Alteromonadales bacterium alter-6D02]
MTKLHKKLLALSPIAASLLLPISSTSLAHGYISKPESRGYLCRLNENSACGSVVYEPQSIEGRDGFPSAGPADGWLASAGHRAFSQLNQQSINRWTKRHVKAGATEFSWTFTAPHSTKDWRYFITKPDWNPNQVLSRDQFEAVPFCEYSGHFKQPPRQLTHLCNIPADRNGYHVVLGVWDVGDTPMSFYNAVDLMIDNGDVGSVEWVDVGDIFASRDLAKGDKVIARVFSESGEVASLAIELEILSALEGEKLRWPQQLAQLINQSQTWIQAGHINEDNDIEPTQGKNEIFAQRSSGITRVELAFELAPLPKPKFSAEGVKKHYYIDEGQVTFDVDVDISKPAQVTLALNKVGQQLQSKTFNLESGLTPLSLAVSQLQVGHYSLSVSYIAENGTSDKKHFHLDVLAKGDLPTEPEPITEAEYTFPQHLNQYKAGTLIYQPKTNKTYECKPWPYNGYCVQWSESANQYEPGVGQYWSMAWIEK